VGVVIAGPLPHIAQGSAAEPGTQRDIAHRIGVIPSGQQAALTRDLKQTSAKLHASSIPQPPPRNPHHQSF